MDIFNVELVTFQIFLIVLVRISGLFVMAPFFSSELVPWELKALTSIFISFVMFPLVAGTHIDLQLDSLPFFILLFKEFMIGVLIGFAASMVMSVFQFTGKMLDVAMSLHMADVVDPLSSEEVSITGQLLYVYGIFILFMTNSHLYMLSGLARSFDVVPIGGLHYSGNLVHYLVYLFSHFFAIGFQIAIPIGAALFVMDFATGLIAKTVPQINVFFVSVPLKIIIGFVLLNFSMSMMLPVFMQLITGMYRDIMSVVILMGGG